MESFSIQRRNRMRSHYTITSNVLLFGYSKLSDAAKVTYQVIDSFDWTDDSGTSKGFAYPSLRLLSRIRGVERRSIRRHLAELESAGVITRRERVGQPSLLIIEDPSNEEVEKYLRDFDRGGEDKSVLPPSDKNVRPLKKEKKKEDKLVNEEQALKRQRGSPLPRLSREARAKREWLAQEMLNVLHDEHSLGFYRKVAASVPQHQIFEALSIVRQISRDGSIRKSKGAAFADRIKHLGLAEHRAHY
jgi:DNA-binding transcriptional ArsR family regulator